MAESLPDRPNLDWLRKQAKRRLEEILQAKPDAQLSDAQLEIARQFGFPSWRALKAHIESLTVEGRLAQAAKDGDVSTLTELLDAHPEKVHLRAPPYDGTLLHLAAAGGHLAAVDLLLKRGLDVNMREGGDNTYPMHWAAAGGHLDVVRCLADAGGDIVGHGDDHEFEVIGWATCFDPSHPEVAEFLVSRGARHHIFSAIALDLGGEVRRIVTADPSSLNRRLSRNESNQLPLHFAIRKNRPAIVSLLLDLGADPLAVDGVGNTAAIYATDSQVDRRVMEAIHRLTSAELLSAERGRRPANGSVMDLVAALSLGDWDTAGRLVDGTPRLLEPTRGVLHLMAKRNDAAALQWVLDRNANPDGLWAHWDADVTPLHLAVLAGHPTIVKVLIERGANPRIRDSKHDSDAFGWAAFFQHIDDNEARREVVAVLRSIAGAG
jgi:ankyrin repeat protein